MFSPEQKNNPPIYKPIALFLTRGLFFCTYISDLKNNDTCQEGKLIFPMDTDGISELPFPISVSPPATHSLANTANKIASFASGLISKLSVV